jgi:hypothetical protein
MASTLTILRSTDAQWPAGRVVPLPEDGLGFWSVRGTLLTRPLSASEVFLRFIADEDGFRAEPGRGGFSMHVNGVRGASSRLAHGDVIGVERFVFRYQTHDWPGPFDAAREATLAEADDAGWAVYADWLVEQGSRQGALFTSEPDVDEQARWLWPLAIELQDARVDALFRRGRVHALTVRDPRLLPISLTEALALGEPVRALKHLSWLQPPQVRGSELEDKVAATLRDLAAIGTPPSLETVSLGLTTQWEGLVDEASLSLVQTTFPRWSTTPASLLTTQRTPGEARLELISPVPVLRGTDATKPLVLKEGESFSVRLLANGEVLVRRGPPQLREDAVRVSLGHDGCRVLAPINRPRVSLPRLGGRQLAFFHLAPGDLVELVPGLRARFVRD